MLGRRGSDDAPRGRMRHRASSGCLTGAPDIAGDENDAATRPREQREEGLRRDKHADLGYHTVLSNRARKSIRPTSDEVVE